MATKSKRSKCCFLRRCCCVAEAGDIVGRKAKKLQQNKVAVKLNYDSLGIGEITDDDVDYKDARSSVTLGQDARSSVTLLDFATEQASEQATEQATDQTEETNNVASSSQSELQAEEAMHREATLLLVVALLLLVWCHMYRKASASAWATLPTLL